MNVVCPCCGGIIMEVRDEKDYKNKMKGQNYIECPCCGDISHSRLQNEET